MIIRQVDWSRGFSEEHRRIHSRMYSGKTELWIMGYVLEYWDNG